MYANLKRSPALMQDQVAALKKIGVAAAMLSSKSSQEDQNLVSGRVGRVRAVHTLRSR